MPVSEIIKKRKSIRKYKADAEVSKEDIKVLLEAAMLAPSACNMRPWEFIVVQDRATLSEITKKHPYTGMLNTASAAIIVVANMNIRDEVSDGFFPQDCGAATENILLQAVEMGLGTCWCGVYPKEKNLAALIEILELPEHLVPFNVIAVGVPDEAEGSRGYYEEAKVTWR